MISKNANLKAWLLSVAMFLSCAAFSVAQSVPSPEDVFGFKVGADYKLADYSQIEDYLSKLDAASNRVEWRSWSKMGTIGDDCKRSVDTIHCTIFW